jgi:hypothetical protein
MVKVAEGSDNLVYKLSTAKKSRSFDSVANVGGFILSIYLIVGVIVIPFNKLMYLKSVVEDTFLVKKTNALMSVM